jgi:hypothetical protein
MRDGVLHTPPMPNRSHQERELDIFYLAPPAALDIMEHPHRNALS